ncbi:MAG: hypothetical protein IKI25_10595 [Bacteroidales bacterium]|nr:hypothetical protein [Bacteroidales bacterium]MBR7036192.1 hypothetical protein [Bacteroidales bacterium]
MRTDLIEKGYHLEQQVPGSNEYVLYKLDVNGNKIEKIWFSNEDKMKRRVERTFIDNVLASELFFDSDDQCVEVITVSIRGDYPDGEYKKLYVSDRRHLFKVEEYIDQECVLIRESNNDGTYTVSLENEGRTIEYGQRSKDIPLEDDEDDIFAGEIYVRSGDDSVTYCCYDNGILLKECVYHCEDASERSPESAFYDSESYLEEETVNDEKGREIKHFKVRRGSSGACRKYGTTTLTEYKKDGGTRILTIIDGLYVDDEKLLVDDYETIYDDYYEEIDYGSFSYEETNGDGECIVYVEKTKFNGKPCIATYKFI